MKNINIIPARVFRLLLMGIFSLIAITTFAQEEQILKGRIIDPKGNPISGVVVNAEESLHFTLSDKDGNFSLDRVKMGDGIIFSLPGYISKTVIADFRENFQVILEPDLDEYLQTTPVAFGRKEKKFVTEATSVVTGEELEKFPVIVLENALPSTVNGVETYEWSSEPGAAATGVFIRGLRTMNRRARAPLVIVDNVERDMTFLDAYSIENITILKDAPSTAIYGMRGANGAIVVTTKRGESGRAKISFTHEMGFLNRIGKMKNQNSYDMAITRNRVMDLDGRDPMFSARDIEMYHRLVNGEKLTGMAQYRYYNTDWNDQVYRDNAPQNRTNFTISGGGNIARYFVSFSSLKQEGLWDDFWAEYNDYSTQAILNRYNLRSNVDIDVTDFLNVSLDLGGRIDFTRRPNTSTFNILTFGNIECNPMEPVFNPNGTVYGSATAQNAGRYIAGTGLAQERRRGIYSTVNVTGNLDALLPGLKANASISFDSFERFIFNQSASMNQYNYKYTEVENLTDVSQIKYTRYRTFRALGAPSTSTSDYAFNTNFRTGLTYANTFGKHTVNAQTFIRTFKNETAGSSSSNRYLSYNGQVNYVYDNRYILSGNVSYMGCDNFAPGYRFGWFPGVSAGWVLSEESWLNNENISLLKLRASFGRAGQSNVVTSKYPYQGTYVLGNGYDFGTSRSTIQGTYESTAGNYNILWEISDMLNLGLDFDLFQKKLYGTVDVFKEWRSGILVQRSNIPSLFGVTVPLDSYGKVESKGFEVSLGHQNRIGSFTYSILGQVTWNTNIITEMDELEPDVEWQRKTGKRIYDDTEVATIYEQAWTNHYGVGGWNMFRFVQWASDPAKIATSKEDAIANPEKYPYNTASSGGQKLGTPVFEDLNGDRQIDVLDKAPDSFTMIPELLPSINITLGWKGFDARIVVDGYLNRSVFLSPAMAWSGWGNMGTQEVVHVWGYYNSDPNDPRNVNAKYPRPTYSGYEPIGSDRGSGTYKNDIWIRRGDYLSLRNVEFGYSLPKSLIARVDITECRIYLSGYNLMYKSFDLPKDVDPEKPMSYVWWYPKTKSFSLGIRIGF
ncbi:MAG: SusC/RagA family TonB-linked outer membrane protein [Bacteroidales bacterium]|nr:SusC/RagA family TonB-linked outer membrane protein [Bacteroidales bacterium]